jgi:hypothetical protein
MPAVLPYPRDWVLLAIGLKAVWAAALIAYVRWWSPNTREDRLPDIEP